MQLELNFEKLNKLSERDYQTIILALESVPFISSKKPTEQITALQNFHNYLIDLVNSEKTINVDNIRNEFRIHMFNTTKTDDFVHLLRDNSHKYINTFMKQEAIINLGAFNPQYQTIEDRNVYLEGKQSLPFEWLGSQPRNDKDESSLQPKQSTVELLDILHNKFAIKHVVLNSLDTPQEHTAKLQTLVYVFEHIAQTLDIAPHLIGFDKLHISLGRENDDCNGWMDYNEDLLVLTQKANESIIAHEWLHWFDSNIIYTEKTLIKDLPTKRLQMQWNGFRDGVKEDKIEKNQFDLSLFDKFSPKSFINRFATNHIKADKKDSFINDLTALNQLFDNFIEKANANSNKEQNSMLYQKVMQEQNAFIQKYNNAQTFPDANFLHRYTSFLKADFQVLNEIIQEKIDTKRSVFSYHALVADQNFGHVYSGDTQELIARSFEAYLDDKCPHSMPLETDTTLWYPKKLERESTNNLWSEMWQKVGNTFGHYSPQRKIENLNEKVLKSGNISAKMNEYRKNNKKTVKMGNI